MYKLISISFFILLSLNAFGQQQVLVTQYFNQIMSFNPAYAGNNQGEINMTHRGQWIGLEGAPSTQILNFHKSLLDNRVGFGAGIQRSSIAITQELTGDLYYSYRIKLKRSFLSMGVQASARNYSADFSDPRIVTTQPREGDPAVPVGQTSVTVPNFGFGVFFKSPQFYLGVSAPRLLQNNIDYANDAKLSRESFHAYLTAGYTFVLSDEISLQPMMLAKFVTNSPVDFDLTLLFRFVEKVGFGMNYRIRNSVLDFKGESISFVVDTKVNDTFTLGVSYDMTLSELRDYTGGSAEFFLRYSFGKKRLRSNPVN